MNRPQTVHPQGLIPSQLVFLCPLWTHSMSCSPLRWPEQAFQNCKSDHVTVPNSANPIYNLPIFSHCSWQGLRGPAGLASATSCFVLQPHWPCSAPPCHTVFAHAVGWNTWFNSISSSLSKMKRVTVTRELALTSTILAGFLGKGRLLPYRRKKTLGEVKQRSNVVLSYRR